VRSFLPAALCCLLLPTFAMAAAIPDDPATGAAELGKPDEDVPYGVAASWLLGHRLLVDGRPADALPLLHQAYRAQPDAMPIALDFQAALVAEGYVRDALVVMDKLVEAHPDSASFRLRRSALLARNGNEDGAMADIRALREQGQDTARLLLTEAGLLDRAGKGDRALELLRAGLPRFPDAAGEIYLEMAGILQRAGRGAELADLLAEAVRADPDRPALWVLQLQALVDAGRDDDALALAREADRRFGLGAPGVEGEAGDGSPEQARIDVGLPADSFVVELADHYARRQKVDQAIALLQPLAARGELGLNASLWLGRMLLGTGKTDEGAKLVDGVTKRWPKAPRGWFLKGKVAEAASDWPQALGLYRKAVELGPDDGEVRLSCIRALLVAREKAAGGTEAKAALATRRKELGEHCTAAAALITDQDTGGHMILGYGFRAGGDLMRAAEHFGTASADEELRQNALIQKSLCHDELGEDALARADLEQLAREFPDNAEVANTLGYWLAEKAIELERAEKLIRQALATDVGNGAYLDSLGWVLYRQGRFEAALDFLIQAVNVLPEDPVILEHLGMVLKAGGQPTQALDVLKRSLSFGADQKRVGALVRELEAGPAPAKAKR
jgi:tetratricopeptide (TPR) repeat protein